MTTLFRSFIVFFLLVVLAVPLSAHTLFQDDFSAGLGHWALDNADYWSSPNGVADVAIPNMDYTFARAIAGDDNWTDYRFDFDVMGLQESAKICYFRYHDPTQGYMLNFRGAVPAEGDPGAVRLFRLNGDLMSPKNPAYWPWGSWDLLLAEPYVSDQGTWYHVSVSVIGPEITVFINGAQVLHYIDTDAPVLTGRIGLAGFTGANTEGGQHVQFDNVVVYVPVLRTEAATWGKVKALYR
jgi:hypothetical protein